MNKSPPPTIILTIAGYDPSGGAGVLADVKTIHAMGGYALAVVTAQTVQNTLRVGAVVPTQAALFADQLRALCEDFTPDAIKIGMIGNAAIARALVDFLDSVTCPVVLDPVIRATHGAALIDEGGLEILKTELLPRVTCITPNTVEAALLPLHNARNVFITGGHDAGEMIVDVLRVGTTETRLTHPRIATRHTHGTGCMISTALAVGLGRGLSLLASAQNAVAHVESALKHPPNVGQGRGPAG